MPEGAFSLFCGGSLGNWLFIITKNGDIMFRNHLAVIYLAGIKMPERT